MSCLYVSNINPLLVISFANTFYHSIDCPFILLSIFFAVQNVLSLIRSLLFIFALRDRSKKILLQFTSKSVLPIFSSRSLRISGLHLAL